MGGRGQSGMPRAESGVLKADLGCSEQAEGAQSDAGMPRAGWGCSGHLQSSPRCRLSWCLLPGRGFRAWRTPSRCSAQAAMPGGACAPRSGQEAPAIGPRTGADWPRDAVAVVVPGLTVGPGLRLVPPRAGIILLNPSERHRWMRLEPPSGSPVSPGSESRAGGGTAAIPGQGPQPPARCGTGPRLSQHRPCARSEGAE